MVDELDSDLSEILDAHTESLRSRDDDETYGSTRDRLKGRYSSNRYLRNEDDLFDDYE